MGGIKRRVKWTGTVIRNFAVNVATTIMTKFRIIALVCVIVGPLFLEVSVLGYLCAMSDADLLALAHSHLSEWFDWPSVEKLTVYSGINSRDIMRLLVAFSISISLASAILGSVILVLLGDFTSNQPNSDPVFSNTSLLGSVGFFLFSLLVIFTFPYTYIPHGDLAFFTITKSPVGVVFLSALMGGSSFLLMPLFITTISAANIWKRKL